MLLGNQLKNIFSLAQSLPTLSTFVAALRAFDAMCQSMQETDSGGGYEGGDLEPHGSRTILSPDWVASSTYPMAGYE